MKKIHFSHRYDKLCRVGLPDKARLVAVFETTRNDMHKDFIWYDCTHHDGAYELPTGPLLVLLFVCRSGMFTTIRANRKHPRDKEAYYRGAVGEDFEVVITEDRP